MFSALQGSAGTLIRCSGKIQHLLIAYFLGNISAKYCENPTMLSQVIAKTLGMFLRHSVVIVHIVPELGHHYLVLQS